MHAIRIAAALLTLAATAAAQTPSIVETARSSSDTVTGCARTRVRGHHARRAGPAWIGYAVRGRERSSGDGCWDSRKGGQRVTPVRLEGSSELFVLYRVEERAVGRIQIAAPDCALDLGGLKLHWLTNVTPAAAASSGLAPSRAARRHGAWPTGRSLAIALHGDAGAVDRLIAIAREGRDRQVRSSALFWISQRAGEQGGGHDHRRHRERSRHTGEAPGGVRAQPAAQGRGGSAAHRRGPEQPQPRRPETGDVLARTVAGPAGAGLFRRGTAQPLKA